jgi:dTDP-4-amino-4,6-dideoxygalactose transaminase
MIPFYDLKSMHSKYRKELDLAISKTIDRSNFISSSHDFEGDFASYTGADFCVGTNSGTSAIHLALLTLGLKSGDEVITVSHTYRGTVAPILYCGAIPVYVDIDPKTFVMDWTKIEEKINSKTKVIMPVHLYGNVAPMKEIIKIAKKHNLKVVEDCSQAHGSRLNGIHVGNFGDIGTFSFYPSKGLGAFGDAGCIITNNKKIEKKLRSLSSWGDYEIGYNYRLSVLQAEVLKIKLKYFDEVLHQKRTIANYYNMYFDNVSTASGVEHSYHIYPILRNNRKKLINNLRNIIELRTHYDTPVHKLNAYKTDDHLPVTEKISSTEVSIPLYSSVDFKKVKDILE